MPTISPTVTASPVTETENYLFDQLIEKWFGKEFDEESQLSYFGARSYDSLSGTWTTQDTYRGEITDPASLHRYGFVSNNPINFIDTDGYFFHKQSWQAVTDTTSAAAGFVKEKTVQVYDYSKTKAIQAYDYTAQAVDTGLTYVKKGVDYALEQTGEAAEFAKEKVISAYDYFVREEEALDEQIVATIRPKPGERLKRKLALEDQIRPFEEKCTFTIAGLSSDKDCFQIAIISEQALAYGINLNSREFQAYKQYREDLLRPLKQKPFPLPLTNLLISEEEIEERQNIADFYKNPGYYIDLSTFAPEDYEELAKGITALEKEQLEELQGIAFGVTGGVSKVGKVAKSGRITKFFEKTGKKVREKFGRTPKTTEAGKWDVNRASSHWKKHRTDFPTLQTAEQYAREAEKFVFSPPKNALIKTRPNGDKIIYDMETNTFAVADKYGSPWTMFKPDPAIHGFKTNLEYFYAQ